MLQTIHTLRTTLSLLSSMTCPEKAFSVCEASEETQRLCQSGEIVLSLLREEIKDLIQKGQFLPTEEFELVLALYICHKQSANLCPDFDLLLLFLSDHAFALETLPLFSRFHSFLTKIRSVRQQELSSPLLASDLSNLQQAKRVEVPWTKETPDGFLSLSAIQALSPEEFQKAILGVVGGKVPYGLVLWTMLRTFEELDKYRSLTLMESVFHQMVCRRLLIARVRMAQVIPPSEWHDYQEVSRKKEFMDWINETILSVQLWINPDFEENYEDLGSLATNVWFSPNFAHHMLLSLQQKPASFSLIRQFSGDIQEGMASHFSSLVSLLANEKIDNQGGIPFQEAPLNLLKAPSRIHKAMIAKAKREKTPRKDSVGPRIPLEIWGIVPPELRTSSFSSLEEFCKLKYPVALWCVWEEFEKQLQEHKDRKEIISPGLIFLSTMRELTLQFALGKVPVINFRKVCVPEHESFPRQLLDGLFDDPEGLSEKWLENVSILSIRKERILGATRKLFQHMESTSDFMSNLGLFFFKGDKDFAAAFTQAGHKIKQAFLAYEEASAAMPKSSLLKPFWGMVNKQLLKVPFSPFETSVCSDGAAFGSSQIPFGIRFLAFFEIVHYRIWSEVDPTHEKYEAYLYLCREIQASLAPLWEIRAKFANSVETFLMWRSLVMQAFENFIPQAEREKDIYDKGGFQPIPLLYKVLSLFKRGCSSSCGMDRWEGTPDLIPWVCHDVDVANTHFYKGVFAYTVRNLLAVPSERSIVLPTLTPSLLVKNPEFGLLQELHNVDQIQGLILNHSFQGDLSRIIECLERESWLRLRYQQCEGERRHLLKQFRKALKERTNSVSVYSLMMASVIFCVTTESASKEEKDEIGTFFSEILKNKYDPVPQGLKNTLLGLRGVVSYRHLFSPKHYFDGFGTIQVSTKEVEQDVHTILQFLENRDFQLPAEKDILYHCLYPENLLSDSRKVAELSSISFERFQDLFYQEDLEFSSKFYSWLFLETLHEMAYQHSWKKEGPEAHLFLLLVRKLQVLTQQEEKPRKDWSGYRRELNIPVGKIFLKTRSWNAERSGIVGHVDFFGVLQRFFSQEHGRNTLIPMTRDLRTWDTRPRFLTLFLRIAYDIIQKVHRNESLVCELNTYQPYSFEESPVVWEAGVNVSGKIKAYAPWLPVDQEKALALLRDENDRILTERVWINLPVIPYAMRLWSLLGTFHELISVAYSEIPDHHPVVELVRNVFLYQLCNTQSAMASRLNLLPQENRVSPLFKRLFEKQVIRDWLHPLFNFLSVITPSRIAHKKPFSQWTCLNVQTEVDFSSLPEDMELWVGVPLVHALCHFILSDDLDSHKNFEEFFNSLPCDSSYIKELYEVNLCQTFLEVLDSEGLLILEVPHVHLKKTITSQTFENFDLKWLRHKNGLIGPLFPGRFPEVQDSWCEDVFKKMESHEIPFSFVVWAVYDVIEGYIEKHPSRMELLEETLSWLHYHRTLWGVENYDLWGTLGNYPYVKHPVFPRFLVTGLFEEMDPEFPKERKFPISWWDSLGNIPVLGSYFQNEILETLKRLMGVTLYQNLRQVREPQNDLIKCLENPSYPRIHRFVKSLANIMVGNMTEKRDTPLIFPQQVHLWPFPEGDETFDRVSFRMVAFATLETAHYLIWRASQDLEDLHQRLDIKVSLVLCRYLQKSLLHFGPLLTANSPEFTKWFLDVKAGLDQLEWANSSLDKGIPTRIYSKGKVHSPLALLSNIVEVFTQGSEELPICSCFFRNGVNAGIPGAFTVFISNIRKEVILQMKNDLEKTEENQGYISPVFATSSLIEDACLPGMLTSTKMEKLNLIGYELEGMTHEAIGYCLAAHVDLLIRNESSGPDPRNSEYFMFPWDWFSSKSQDSRKLVFLAQEDKLVECIFPSKRTTPLITQLSQQIPFSLKLYAAWDLAFNLIHALPESECPPQIKQTTLGLCRTLQSNLSYFYLRDGDFNGNTPSYKAWRKKTLSEFHAAFETRKDLHIAFRLPFLILESSSDNGVPVMDYSFDGFLGVPSDRIDIKEAYVNLIQDLVCHTDLSKKTAIVEQFFWDEPMHYNKSSDLSKISEFQEVWSKIFDLDREIKEWFGTVPASEICLLSRESCTIAALYMDEIAQRKILMEWVSLVSHPAKRLYPYGQMGAVSLLLSGPLREDPVFLSTIQKILEDPHGSYFVRQYLYRRMPEFPQVFGDFLDNAKRSKIPILKSLDLFGTLPSIVRKEAQARFPEPSEDPGTTQEEDMNFKEKERKEKTFFLLRQYLLEMEEEKENFPQKEEGEWSPKERYEQFLQWTPYLKAISPLDSLVTQDPQAKKVIQKYLQRELLLPSFSAKLVSQRFGHFGLTVFLQKTFRTYSSFSRRWVGWLNGQRQEHFGTLWGEWTEFLFLQYKAYFQTYEVKEVKEDWVRFGINPSDQGSYITLSSPDLGILNTVRWMKLRGLLPPRGEAKKSDLWYEFIEDSRIIRALKAHLTPPLMEELWQSLKNGLAYLPARMVTTYCIAHSMELRPEFEQWLKVSARRENPENPKWDTFLKQLEKGLKPGVFDPDSPQEQKRFLPLHRNVPQVNGSPETVSVSFYPLPEKWRDEFLASWDSNLGNIDLESISSLVLLWIVVSSTSSLEAPWNNDLKFRDSFTQEVLSLLTEISECDGFSTKWDSRLDKVLVSVPLEYPVSALFRGPVMIRNKAIKSILCDGGYSLFFNRDTIAIYEYHRENDGAVSQIAQNHPLSFLDPPVDLEGPQKVFQNKRRDLVRVLSQRGEQKKLESEGEKPSEGLDNSNVLEPIAQENVEFEEVYRCYQKGAFTIDEVLELLGLSPEEIQKAREKTLPSYKITTRYELQQFINPGTSTKQPPPVSEVQMSEYAVGQIQKCSSFRFDLPMGGSLPSPIGGYSLDPLPPVRDQAIQESILESGEEDLFFSDDFEKEADLVLAMIKEEDPQFVSMSVQKPRDESGTRYNWHVDWGIKTFSSSSDQTLVVGVTEHDTNHEEEIPILRENKENSMKDEPMTPGVDFQARSNTMISVMRQVEASDWEDSRTRLVMSPECFAHLSTVLNPQEFVKRFPVLLDPFADSDVIQTMRVVHKKPQKNPEEIAPKHLDHTQGDDGSSVETQPVEVPQTSRPQRTEPKKKKRKVFARILWSKFWFLIAGLGALVYFLFANPITTTSKKVDQSIPQMVKPSLPKAQKKSVPSKVTIPVKVQDQNPTSRPTK